MEDRSKKSQLRLVAWNMGPYGWRARAGPDGEVFFEPQAKELLWIHYMKQLYEFKFTEREIAHRLNKDGISGPCGSPWIASAVRELLHRDDTALWEGWIGSDSKKIQAG